jgi:hypothetical protein
MTDIVARTAKLNQDFYLAMRSEDDLGLIVRGHIFVEHQVREYVAAAAPKPELFKFSDFDYFSTVRIAFILGLDAEFNNSLPALGSLRNKFSHRLDMKLDDQMADNFYKTFGPVTQGACVISYADLVKADEIERGAAKTFHDLGPRDRMAISILSLRGGILAQTLETAGMLDRYMSEVVNNPKK